MNDLLYLTIEPVEGGHAIPWGRLWPLLEGLEDGFARAADALEIPDLAIDAVHLVLCGSPVIGSLRFQFRLEVKGEFVRSPRGIGQYSPEKKSLKQLAQEVGVQALGSVIGASIMLAFAGPPEEPVYGPEAKIAELCASRIKAELAPVVGELQILTQQAQCSSAKLQYEAYPPLELAGKSRPLKIGAELKHDPADRLEVFLSSPQAVDIYLNGERRTAYFVTRLDTETEALAIFREPIPKTNLNDRLLIQSRRLKPRDRRDLFISPLSLQGAEGVGIEKRLAGVRSVLVVEANHGAMRSAAIKRR